MNAFIDIVRRPTGFIFEQTNATDAFVTTKVEPVPGALGYIDQITGSNGDAENRSAFRMDMKTRPLPSTVKRTSSSVCMCSLSNLASISSSPGVSGLNVDDIGGDESARFFQAINLGLVFVKNLLIRRIIWQPACDVPILKLNSKRVSRIR